MSKKSRPKTILIEVSGGLVQEVCNLPDDWTYTVADFDNAESGVCPLCGAYFEEGEHHDETEDMHPDCHQRYLTLKGESNGREA
jgi:hypothetical protein